MQKLHHLAADRDHTLALGLGRIERGNDLARVGDRFSIRGKDLIAGRDL